MIEKAVVEERFADVLVASATCLAQTSIHVNQLVQRKLHQSSYSFKCSSILSRK